jgi:hypothetical protein
MQRPIPGMHVLASLANNRFAQMFASATTEGKLWLLSLSSSNLITLAVLDYSKRESYIKTVTTNT